MNIAKKITAIILSCVMLWTLAPLSQAYATENVVTTLSDLKTALNNGGKIKLGSDIGSNEQLKVNGNTTLDLNGHKLSIVDSYYTSFVIPLGMTLTITDSKYTDKNPGNGKLYVKGEAGIQTTGATLIINSGVVEAIGNDGAGIGGSNDIDFCDGGTVIINGGLVTATGGIAGTYGGAGIGGVEKGNGGTITINGGKITATGGGGAGIGGGGTAGYDGGNGGTISINGGKVTAIGGWGSGIGSGNSYGNIGTVKITGGTVRTKAGGENTFDVGSGKNNSIGGSLNITDGTLELTTKDRGINAETPYFANCMIEGVGAGNYKGVYDAKGKLKKVNITFDGNGGKIGNKLKVTVENTCIRNMKLPNTPIRSGYIFKGWYTKAKDSEKITGNTTVLLTVKTYYAQWTKKK